MPDSASLRSTLTRHVGLTLTRLLGRPFAKSTVLAGSGRSGTTWVGNIINHANDHRVLFEPIHRIEVPAFAHFKNRQYLREQNADPAYLAPVQRLFDGTISNAWVDSRNTNWFARKLLIKDIRANLLLKWITHHHPETKVILLLRHPYAVASSRVKLGWSPFPDAFLTQPELMADLLEPFRDVLEAQHNDLVGNVVCWCVENFVPLALFPAGALYVCYYERLILDGENEVRRLMAFLGEPVPERLESVLSRTSDTNWNAGRRPTPDFDQWKREIRSEDHAETRDILDRFGMGRFYDDQGYPLTTTFGS